MIMSRRLKHIAAQVTPCNVLADIGCDHGHLPVYLVQKGSIKKAVATDISKDSCIKAQNNIDIAGLEDKIDVRCGDGLEPVTVEDNAECTGKQFFRNGKQPTIGIAAPKGYLCCKKVYTQYRF